MSDSGGDSPDWLRSFQPPSATIALSSGSESPVSHSPVSDDEDEINLTKLFKKKESRVPDVEDEENEKVKLTTGRKKKGEDDSNNKKGSMAKSKVAKRKTAEEHGSTHESKYPVLSLSSDSESDTIPTKKIKVAKKEIFVNNEDEVTNDKEYKNDSLLSQDGESPKNLAPKGKSPKKKLEKEDENTSNKKNIKPEDNDDNNIVKEDMPESHPGPQVSSSRVPLMLSEKVQRTKALVECEGDSIDLSGDVGSVGRIVISDDHSKNHDMLLDLKGTIYKTTIVPSRTFCVVSFGQSEAKIEAIMNEYIQLKSQSNVYEAETMVEGTLEGFSFSSEDEADKVPKPAQGDQQEGAEEQPVGKTKRKAAKTGTGKNKGKAAGGKPAKKAQKKPQAQKKSKAKK